MPLVEYVEKIKGFSKHPLINLLIYSFFSPTNFGLYNVALGGRRTWCLQ
jgi:hypothetical protein